MSFRLDGLSRPRITVFVSYLSSSDDVGRYTALILLRHMQGTANHVDLHMLLLGRRDACLEFSRAS